MRGRKDTYVMSVVQHTYEGETGEEVHCLDMTPQDICRRPWRTREP